MSIVQLTISKVGNGFVLQSVDDNNVQSTLVQEGTDQKKLLGLVSQYLPKMTSGATRKVKESDEGTEY